MSMSNQLKFYLKSNTPTTSDSPNDKDTGIYSSCTSHPHTYKSSHSASPPAAKLYTFPAPRYRTRLKHSHSQPVPKPCLHLRQPFHFLKPRAGYHDHLCMHLHDRFGLWQLRKLRYHCGSLVRLHCRMRQRNYRRCFVYRYFLSCCYLRLVFIRFCRWGCGKLEILTRSRDLIVPIVATLFVSHI
jgi:hypothetical protein